MRPAPGDKVVITENAWDNMVAGMCMATKGSIARVLSLEEYCEYIAKDPTFIEYPHYVKQWMEDGEQFPVQFEYVAPLITDNPSDFVYFRDDRVVVLCQKFFQRLER